MSHRVKGVITECTGGHWRSLDHKGPRSLQGGLAIRQPAGGEALDLAPTGWGSHLQERVCPWGRGGRGRLPCELGTWKGGTVQGGPVSDKDLGQ